VVAHIEASGGTGDDISSYGARTYITATVPKGDVSGLSQLDAVQSITEVPEVHLRNDTNFWIAQRNIVGPPPATPLWDAGLRGEGQVVHVIDQILEKDHCAFQAPGKIVELRHESFGGQTVVCGPGTLWGRCGHHGTFVAGIAVGDDGTYGTHDAFDGLATAAGLRHTWWLVVQEFHSTFREHLEHAHIGDRPAYIHSNSWGSLHRAYSTLSRQLDDFTRDFEDDVVIVAVDNITHGPLIHSPENAKNSLAVAASKDTPNQHLWCEGADGPTEDGRRKPELMAPGCGTTSAKSRETLDDGFCDFGGIGIGTSLAAPVVSAAAALIRQYFTQGFYPTGTAWAYEGGLTSFTPTGALMRAVLINATVDMTGITSYPSDTEGWGRLLLDASLHFPGDADDLWIADVRHADGLDTTEFMDFNIQVVDSGVPLRVTMVFADVPGTVGVTPVVVNNLDLQVTAPGAAVYKGNWFLNGQSATGGSFDALNTVERVVLNTPPVGTYSIRVSAPAIQLGGPQGFALAVSADLFNDCNENSVSDDQDISGQTSEDCNGNGVPDECEADCNANGVADECDIASDPNLDCNNNKRIDDCDIPLGSGGQCVGEQCDPDCDGDGVIDSCEIADCAGQGVPGCQDCNNNGVPDECDISEADNGLCINRLPQPCSEDSTQNGIPDECEPDCNGNGIADSTDIAEGDLDDLNHDGIPDNCVPRQPLPVEMRCDTDFDCSPSSYVQCTTDTDCVGDPNASYCAGGICGCPGGIDAQCPDGSSCRGALCVSLDPGGATCVEHDCRAAVCVEYDCPRCPGELRRVCECPGGTDAECLFGAVCVDYKCYVPRNRYISFQTQTRNPSPSQGMHTGFRIVVNSGDNVSGCLGRGFWVGAPVEVDLPPTGSENNILVAQLQDEPYYQNPWPDDVHVTGLEIAPDATYVVEAVFDKSGYFAMNSITLPTSPRPGGSKWWGDTVGKFIAGHWQPPNGYVAIDDAVAAIKAFQHVNAPDLSRVDVIRVGESNPELMAIPDGRVDILDVFQLILGFTGKTYYWYDRADDCFDTPIPPRPAPPGGEYSTLSLAANAATIQGEETVDVEVFIGDAADFAGYQLSIESAGGTSGSLLLDALFVDNTRQDYVFYGVNDLVGIDEVGGRIGVVNADGVGIGVSGPAYLGTFRLEASADAEGVFNVSLGGLSGSFILTGGGLTRTDTVLESVDIEVVACTVDADCDDTNPCTDDTCEAGVCMHTNNDSNTCTDGNACTADECLAGVCTSTNEQSGTACDDGLFCTKTDTCDGDGACVGAGTPCTKPPDTKCCEYAEECILPSAYCTAPL